MKEMIGKNDRTSAKTRSATRDANRSHTLGYERHCRSDERDPRRRVRALSKKFYSLMTGPHLRDYHLLLDEHILLNISRIIRFYPEPAQFLDQRMIGQSDVIQQNSNV
jgi:hypothetical protein